MPKTTIVRLLPSDCKRGRGYPEQRCAGRDAGPDGNAGHYRHAGGKCHGSKHHGAAGRCQRSGDAAGHIKSLRGLITYSPDRLLFAYQLSSIKCPLCARSGTCLHRAMLVCREQVKSIKWFVSVDHGSLCAWSLGGIQPHSLANGKKEIYLLTRGQRV